MKARLVKFGEIEVEGKRYTHDVVIDGGKVRKRKKGPSKQFRETARYRGHCGAHIGSLSAAGGSEEGPSVRHLALHVLTGDLGDRIGLKVWPSSHCQWTSSQNPPLDT